MTDFRARLQQTWTENHGQPPTWVEEMLLDHYAERMDAAMGRFFGDVVDWKPLGLLGVDVAPWLADELDFKGVSPLGAALAAAACTHDTPPAALRRPRPTIFALMDTVTARMPGSTVEEHVARELVPLVRAAASEVPLPPRVEVLGGHLRDFRTVDAALDQHDGEQQWGEFLDRWHLTPELTRRPHSSSLPCWCDGFMRGAAVHLDEHVPPGDGWAFERRMDL